MPKCEPGCTCKKHTSGRPNCPPDCTCGRHKKTDEWRANVSAGLRGKSKGAPKCKPDCACGRHSNRSSAQFQPGSAGFTGRHSDETRAKLASYSGERASAYKHGLSQTITYSTWSSMISRCYDPRNASHKRYGARGVTVCDRWQDFLTFLADMGERPSKLYSIDRIDNARGYEPGNCRWATRAEQGANRRDPGGWKARRAREDGHA